MHNFHGSYVHFLWYSRLSTIFYFVLVKSVKGSDDVWKTICFPFNWLIDQYVDWLEFQAKPINNVGENQTPH